MTSDEQEVVVCDECFMACCWQGVFMCEKARTAGTTLKTVGWLKKQKLECPDYWKASQ